MQTDSSFTFVLFGGTGDLSMRKAVSNATRALLLFVGLQLPDR